MRPIFALRAAIQGNSLHSARLVRKRDQLILSAGNRAGEYALRISIFVSHAHVIAIRAASGIYANLLHASRKASQLYIGVMVGRSLQIAYVVPLRKRWHGCSGGE